MNEWPTAELLESRRVSMEPLTIRHAGEMAEVLEEPALYRYTGGHAPSTEELTERYARQVTGRSADGRQGWLNWVVRRRDSGEAIGFTQATLTREGEAVVAEIAWVVNPRHQRNGFASEAAVTMRAWLRSRGIERFVAFIAPSNQPSISVARNLSMRASGLEVDGEDLWRG
ncbi:GNAT family N-acetyltransferase [Actinomycetaceae bacterium L2_0104]